MKRIPVKADIFRSMADGLSVDRLSQILAWGVHLITASGAVWGLLSIHAIYQHNWKLLFVWIAVAMLADGLDGTLSRRLRVKERIPQIDGALLDNLVDYLNYVIVPCLLLLEAQLLPADLAWPACAGIALASGYQFSQVDAKTSDHYFKGFPSYWNFLALYLFVLQPNPWLNLAIVLLCIGLVFVPIKYLYPSRTPGQRRLNVLLAVSWGALGFLGLMLYPHTPGWLWGLTLLYPGYYLSASLLATLQQRRRAA